MLRLSGEQQALFGKDEVYELLPEYYLIKVNSFDDIAKDTLDEWIYFLKNEEIRDEFSAKGIKKANQELDIMKFSEEERRAYAALSGGSALSGQHGGTHLDGWQDEGA